MNPFKYLNEVRTEVAKVTWPTRTQATQMTINVLIAAFFISIFIAAADWVFVRSLESSLLTFKANRASNAESNIIDINPEDIQVEATPIQE